MNMKSQVKEKWIAALRSGEYDQGIERLRTLTRFCCLGVLCDLYSKETGIEWNYHSPSEGHSLSGFEFDGQREFLPSSVVEWSGLETRSPEINILVSDEDEEYLDTQALAELNDNGENFFKIADLIEENF
jgi:hypothetical protein